MPDPVSFRSPAEIDTAYRHVVAAHSREASLQGPPEHHTDPAVAAGTAAEGAIAAYEVGESLHLIAHPGAAAGAGPALTIGAPLVALGVGLAEINHAWHEHDRRGAEVDHHQMRGAVLYVLGRIPNPDRSEVVEQFGTHERDGARDAARFERLRPAQFEALRGRTLTSFHGGENAALLGNLRGSALESALRDPIFRMGYEETQALRTSDPAAFEARASEARALASAVQHARATVPISG